MIMTTGMDTMALTWVLATSSKGSIVLDNRGAHEYQGAPFCLYDVKFAT